MARPPVTIRRATAQDRAFIQTLGARTVMDSVASGRNALPGSVIANYEQLLETVERRSHVMLIAEQNAKPLGFLLMIDDLPDEVTAQPQAFVAYMAVERSHRGLGVGSALIAAAEDEARRSGLPYMALMVTEENEAARALYRRSGYGTERRLLCKEL